MAHFKLMKLNIILTCVLFVAIVFGSAAIAAESQLSGSLNAENSYDVDERIMDLILSQAI